MLKPSDVRVGDTVRVVPIGQPCRVEYNDNGVISGVYFLNPETDDVEKCSSDFCAKMQKLGIVPSRIQNGKKCCVDGVIKHTNLKISNLLDYGAQKCSIAAVETMQSGVEFAAYSVSGEAVVRNAYQQDSMLKLMGFSLCPGFAVTQESVRVGFNQLKAMSDYPFVDGYAITCKGTNSLVYFSSDISYDRVAKVASDWNSIGYIIACVQFESGVELECSYSDIVKYNVQKGSICALDETSIKYCSDRSNGSKRVNSKVQCKCCGSTVNIGFKGYFRCPYNNCMSNLYPVVKHMLKTFELPDMEYSEYRKLANGKKVQSLCDVIALPRYAGLDVRCTVSMLLYAVCPASVVPVLDFFDQLAEAAGSFEACMHYLEHPNEIRTDMSGFLNARYAEKFIQWISKSENLLIVKSMCYMPNVHIKKESFELPDVPQLFRNKRVYIEGPFRHGSYSDVAGIVRSYGADVVSAVDARCNCCIVGDINKEYKSSQQINIAHTYSIPVFAESNFFKHYGIDSDIANANQHKNYL